MPIPLFPMLSFSIISHRVSLGCLIHLSLGRPLPLRPSNFPSKIFFTDLVSFILTTCPSHSNLRIFITFTISGALYLVVSSAFVLIPHCPFSFVVPYIFLNIFLSHVISNQSSPSLYAVVFSSRHLQSMKTSTKACH